MGLDERGRHPESRVVFVVQLAGNLNPGRGHLPCIGEGRQRHEILPDVHQVAELGVRATCLSVRVEEDALIEVQVDEVAQHEATAEDVNRLGLATGAVVDEDVVLITGDGCRKDRYVVNVDQVTDNLNREEPGVVVRDRREQDLYDLAGVRVVQFVGLFYGDLFPLRVVIVIPTIFRRPVGCAASGKRGP